MGRIILARSGMTEYDEDERIAGSLDMPLSAKGRAEAEDLARDLKSFEVEAVYAAAGEASLATARLIADEHDLKVKQLSELRNQNFGCWEGLRLEELRRMNPRVYKLWEENPCAVEPPNGEMVDEVRARAEKLVKPLLKKHDDAGFILVAPDPLRKLIRCWLKRTAADLPWETSGPLWEAFDFGAANRLV
jgi:broad specificity phosphatase PhoE